MVASGTDAVRPNRLHGGLASGQVECSMFSYGVRHTVILTWRALTGSRFEGDPSRLGLDSRTRLGGRSMTGPFEQAG